MFCPMLVSLFSVFLSLLLPFPSHMYGTIDTRVLGPYLTTAYSFFTTQQRVMLTAVLACACATMAQFGISFPLRSFTHPQIHTSD
jgi:hypothetical protein